jgi:hypothetical protein
LRRLLPIGLLLPLLASPAHAAPAPGTVELWLFSGVAHEVADFGEFSLAAGLAANYLLSSRLALELDVSHALRLGEPLEAAVTTATVDLVYHVNPRDNGVFYLAAGGGGAWFHAADGGIDNHSTGAGVAALGVKIYLGARILLRVDSRYFYAPSPFTDHALLNRTTLGIGVRF